MKAVTVMCDHEYPDVAVKEKKMKEKQHGLCAHGVPVQPALRVQVLCRHRFFIPCLCP